MKWICLLFAGAALVNAEVDAAPLVSDPNPSSEIHGGGYGSSGSVYLYAPLVYHHDFDVRNRLPLHNHVDWELEVLEPSFARLEVQSSAYSTFIPASSGIDRFGNPTFSPARYDDSTVSAKIPLALETRALVTVSLAGAGLRGLESFDIDYFGRSQHYASNPGAGMQLPGTTFDPVNATADPLDVHDFADQFWADAGSYLLTFEMRTTHVEGAPFLDGGVSLIVTFSTVSEPAAAPILSAIGLMTAFYRRRSKAKQLKGWHGAFGMVCARRGAW